MDTRLIRQFDILKPSPLDIHIVGAGGIGSWTALVLAKMGYENITVYDFDNVEDHNIATQFYKQSDLDTEKTKALAENIEMFSGIKIKTSGKPDVIKCEVLILAVDNMESRKEITSKAVFDFCVDARMGGQIFNIFSFFPFEIQRYDKTLFSDADAVQDPCTAKSICYNVFGIASFIGNIVKRFDKGEHLPFELNGDYINLRLDKTKS
jgi:hypothetical protein